MKGNNSNLKYCIIKEIVLKIYYIITGVVIEENKNNKQKLYNHALKFGNLLLTLKRISMSFAYRLISKQRENALTLKGWSFDKISESKFDKAVYLCSFIEDADSFN